MGTRRDFDYTRSASSASTCRIESRAGVSGRGRPGELVQLSLDQPGQLIDLWQRVRVGVAAEEKLLAIAHHPNRERMTLDDRHDGVDLFELAAQQVERPSRGGRLRDGQVELPRRG